MVRRGLQATAALWPEIARAYGWVHQAAHLLANAERRSAVEVQQVYSALLAEMSAQRATLPTLAPAIEHFLKVTASYWPGLFHCYTVPDLPRTNNDLEQYFGAARYQERRATGRKGAAAGLVVRGPVRVVAAVATGLHPFSGPELRPVDLAQWQALRQSVEHRHETRRAQRRFRRDPQAYLAQCEDLLLQLRLPS
jgi:hypothetical protein